MPAPTSPRRSGILLHPTSLPGRFGIGELGPEADRFADFLADAGQRLWQVLPLGPTGYGDSPYQCFSAFAGNPLLIGLDALVEDGWLSAADLQDTPEFPVGTVDYDAVAAFKLPLLDRAFRRFEAAAGPERTLTRAQARSAGLGAIADQFDAIDRARRGAIRFEDYERFLELRR